MFQKIGTSSSCQKGVDTAGTEPEAECGTAEPEEGWLAGGGGGV